ncbi:hypothetical protein LBMAG42_55380 [Deltaproteobacteria bacterium]|nr:hypothetical protein LBMAG42_55380 [Deltaproteobacteria bacterium]
MFKCEVCEGGFGPGVAPVKLTVERRPRTYPLRWDVNPEPKGFRRVEGQLACVDDPGGQGWEIVREVVACRGCAAAGATGAATARVA